MMLETGNLGNIRDLVKVAELRQVAGMGNYLHMGNDGFRSIRKGLYLDITLFISTRCSSAKNIVEDMQERVIQELVSIYLSIVGQDERSLPEALSQISGASDRFIIPMP